VIDAQPLSAEERAAVARIADLLIPRTATMPSGTDAEAHGAFLDRVFEVRPDVIEAVRRGLAQAPAALPTAVADLEPAAWDGLRPVADAVTAAYFINPEVARLVGYRKRSVIPIRFDEDLDGLVAEVVARGPIYRPTPASP
jgi:hypothetical protein